MITSKLSVHFAQVLQRIDDVQLMCDKREATLRKHAARHQRPVQPVIPEPAVPLQPPGGAPRLFRMRRNVSIHTIFISFYYISLWCQHIKYNNL